MTRDKAILDADSIIGEISVNVEAAMFLLDDAEQLAADILDEHEETTTPAGSKLLAYLHMARERLEPVTDMCTRAQNKL